VDYYKKPKNLSLESLEIDISDESSGGLVEEIRQDKEEKTQTLWRGIDTLPLSERDVLILHYKKNLKISEIAKIKRKSENAIKLTLSRARKKLKDMYGLESLPNLSNKKPTPSKKKFLF
jgi:RNA polymerase sigma-70 factor (ECF subfamily)